jgi:crossover junction endodeoxyribonuclease RuvC
MRIVGIDPGLTGGIAALDTANGDYHVQDLPVSRDKSLSWIDGLQLLEILKVYGPNKAIVERVSTMPKQGISSGFHFGMGFGAILAVLQAAHVPFELVTPVVWKKWLQLPGGKDKTVSLDRARSLYPKADLKRKKDHGRGEALLIATWGARGAVPM